MPMHDWTRVNAGTYHDFHCSWLAELKNHLNRGLLPVDHYAQVKQAAEAMIADVLTLRSSDPRDEADESSNGELAVAAAPPKVRFTESLEVDLYATHAKQIAIRHTSDDQIVALIELLSPGNKSSEFAFRAFVNKALEALRRGCHLLLIDPFPPTSRDPRGIHGAIWEELGGVYDPPPDKPLTLVSYDAGFKKTAYVEPFAVGDTLTAMPLLLTSARYVPSAGRQLSRDIPGSAAPMAAGVGVVAEVVRLQMRDMAHDSQLKSHDFSYGVGRPPFGGRGRRCRARGGRG